MAAQAPNDATRIYAEGAAAAEKAAKVYTDFKAQYPDLIGVDPGEWNVIRQAALTTNPEDPESELYKWGTAYAFGQILGQRPENLIGQVDSLTKWYVGANQTPKSDFRNVVDAWRWGAASDKMGELELAKGNLESQLEHTPGIYAGGLTTGPQATMLQNQIKAYQDQIDAHQQFLGAMEDKFPRNSAIGMLETTAKMGPFIAKLIGTSVAVGAITGGAGITGVAANLISKAAAMAVSQGSVAGNAYRQLRDSGVKPTLALGLAQYVAAPLENITMLSMGEIGAMVGKPLVGKLIGSKISKAFAVTGLWGSIGQAVTTYGKNLGEMGLMGSLNSMTADATTAIAAVIQGEGVDVPTSAQVAEKAWESMKGGIYGGVLLGVPGLVIGTVKAERQASKLIKAAAGFTDRDQFIAAAKESPIFDQYQEADKAIVAGKVWDKGQERHAEAIKTAVESKLDSGLQPTAEGAPPDVVLTPTQEPVRWSTTEEKGVQQLRGTVDSVQTQEGKKPPTVWANYQVDDANKTIKLTGVMASNDMVARDKVEAKAQIGAAVMELRRQYPDHAIEWAPKSRSASWIKAEIERQSPGFFSTGYKEGITAGRLEAQAQSIDPSNRAVGHVVADFLQNQERWLSNKEGRAYDPNRFAGVTFDKSGIVRNLDQFAPEERASIEGAIKENGGVKGMTLFVDQRTGKVHFDVADIKGIREHVRAAIYLAGRADAGTVIHELVHVMDAMHGFDGEELALLEKHFGVKYEDWGTKEREDLAYSAVQYAKTGNSPEGLKGILAKLLSLFHSVTVAARSQGAKLSPELAEFHRRFFTRGEGPGRQAAAEVKASNEVHAKEEAKLRTSSPKQREAKEKAPEKAAPEPDLAETLPPPSEATKAELSRIYKQIVPGQKFTFDEVPVKDILNHQDVQQFKENGDANGVVERLPGEADRTGMGPVVLYKDKAGKYYIVTGRHRLDIFRRSGELTIPAHVFHEENGFTTEHMQLLDAELNIRDNQGSERDFAAYFRHSGYDREGSEARGLLRGDKAKLGFALGRLATDNTYALYRADAYDHRALAAIAESAPGDERLQAIGVATLHANPRIDPTVLFNTIKLSALEGADNSGPRQGEFGDWATPNIKDQIAMGEAALKIQRDIKGRVQALKDTLSLSKGTSKTAEIEGTGTRFGDKTSMKLRIEELSNEALTWANWTSDPAKRREARIAAGLEVKDMPPAEAPAKAQDTETQPLFERDVERISYRFPEDLKGYADIHSQAQVSGILNSFGRGVIDSKGDIRMGDAGASHVGLASGMQDAKRFYFGYSKEKNSVYVVSKNGMDDTFLHSPAVMKVILSNIFDKYRLNVKAGSKLQFGDEVRKDTQAYGKGPLFEQDDPFPWVYKSEEVARDKLKGPMPGTNILKMLQSAGVKAEEMKWTGLDDYLNTDKKLSPKEVLDFIQANKLQIQEVNKDSGGIGMDEARAEFSKYKLPGGENYREVLFTLSTALNVDALWAQKDAIDKQIFDQPSGSPERWALVEKAQAIGDRIDAEARKPKYQSGHWSEPNVLAHARLDDRITPDGKRMLFVEESQSDWHQEGRKSGYSIPRTEWDAANARLDEAIKAKGDDSPEANAVRDEMKVMNARDGNVPPAPFSKTWHEFIFKRILRMAAEDGYDSVGWTTGEQQAARYDLSQQIRDIQYRKVGEDSYSVGVQNKNGNTVWGSDNASAAELEGVIGKELTQKIVDAEPAQKGKVRTLSGLDLKMGGEGMGGFYDKMIPDFANKYAKKWGSKVEDTSLTGEADGHGDWRIIDDSGTAPGRMMVDGSFPTREDAEAFAERKGLSYYAVEQGVGDTVHTMPVTAEMREGVKKGQYLFEQDAPRDELKSQDKKAKELEARLLEETQAGGFFDDQTQGLITGQYKATIAALKMARTSTVRIEDSADPQKYAVLEPAARSGQPWTISLFDASGQRGIFHYDDRASALYDFFTHTAPHFDGAAAWKVKEPDFELRSEMEAPKAAKDTGGQLGLFESDGLIKRDDTLDQVQGALEAEKLKYGVVRSHQSNSLYVGFEKDGQRYTVRISDHPDRGRGDRLYGKADFNLSFDHPERYGDGTVEDLKAWLKEPMKRSSPLAEDDDLLNEARAFDDRDTFVKTYGTEGASDGEIAKLGKAWDEAHTPQIDTSTIEAANTDFRKRLTSNDFQGLKDFLEAEGVRLLDSGQESPGLDVLEATALKVARGMRVSESSTSMLMRAIERNPDKWRRRYAEVMGDEAMKAQLDAEKGGKASNGFEISAPTEDFDLVALEARMRGAIKALDPSLQGEFDDRQASYGEAMRSEQAVHQGTTDLQAELGRLEGELRGWKGKFSPEEGRIAALTQEAQDLEKQLRLDKIRKKAGTFKGDLEDLQATIDDKRAAIQSRMDKLSPQAVMKDTAYQATKLAIAETRAKIKGQLQRAQAKKAEKDLMIALAKSILDPVSKSVDFKIGEQIRAIQKSIDPNFRRDMRDWPIEQLRKLFHEGPALGQILPADVVERLSKRPLNDWTRGELQDLADRVDSLRELGRSLLATRNAERNMGRYDVQAAVVKQLNDSGKLKEQPPYGSKEFDAEHKKDFNVFKEWDLSLQTIHRVATKLDNGVKGAFYKSLVEGERAAFSTEKDNFDRRWGAIEKRVKELKLDVAQMYRDSVAVGDNHYSRWDVMGMHIGMMNPDTRDAILFGNLMNQEQREGLSDNDFNALASRNERDVGKAVQELTIPEKELADFFVKDANAEIERLREATYQYENKMPVAVENYFPHERKMRTGEGGLQEQQAEDLLNRSSRLPRGVGKQPTIERIKIGQRHQMPIALDALGVYKRGIERQEHYIGYGSWVQDMNKIFMDGRSAATVRYSIKQAHGQGYLNYIDRWIKESANPRAFDDPLKPLGGVDRMLRFMRGPLGVAYLGFRASTAFKQLITSPMPYFPYAPANMVARTLMHLNPVEFAKANAFAMEHSAILRHRDAFLGLDALKRYADNPKAVASLKRAASASMKLVEWADRWSVVTGWTAVYDKTLGDLRTKGGLSAEDMVIQAAKEADDVTVKTQPTSRSQDLSPMFKSDNQVMRFLLQFQTPLNVIYNQIFHDAPGDMTHGHAGRSLGIVAGYLATGSILALLAAPRKDDDDPTKLARQALAGAMRTPLDVIPIFGAIASAAAQKLVTGEAPHYGSSGLFPGMETLFNGAVGVVSAKDEDAVRKSAMSFAQGLGMLGGLPTKAAMEYYRVLFQGDWRALMGRPKE